MFMSNSIGLATAGRSTEEFDEIPTIRYMFDNDKTGKEKMMQKLRRGKEIFMWGKFLNDTKLDLKYDKWLDGVNKENRDKYPKELGDLNDLVRVAYYLKDDCLKNLSEYFSNSKLDAFYL